MKKKNEVVVAEPVTPEVVEPTALTVKSTRMPKIKGKTPGQRINFLHKLSVASGKLSICAGIMAGWELSRAKGKCEHGQWLKWLAANTELSPTTASRYMDVYKATLGAARAALPEPVSADVTPTPAELNEAAANVDAPTLNGLYSQLKILKHNDDHGGKREGAGRKPKDAAKAVTDQLDEIANSETLLWADLKGALDTLVKLDAEKDVWRRLSDKHLSSAVEILADMAEKSSKAMMGRMDKSKNNLVNPVQKRKA